MSGKTRRVRVPFSGPRKKLDVIWADKKSAEAYVARWVNDQGNRIQDALAAGYDFVLQEEIAGVGVSDVHSGNTDIGSRVSRVVGRTNTNDSIRAYLMKIEKGFYDEDQLAKESHNQLTDHSVRAGTVGGAMIGNQYGKVDLR